MNSMGFALAVIAVVGVVAWLMRGSRDETAGGEARPAAPDLALGHDEAGPEEGDLIEAAAVTSDGWAFVPAGSGVELVPPGLDEEDDPDSLEEPPHGARHRSAHGGVPVNPHTGKRMVHWNPGEPLAPGDLVAARVVRGAPGVDPWRLEALGRDHDYRAYAFETEEGARTALELVEQRIVEPPVDEAGEPIPVGAEDFAVARRKSEETEAALAMEANDEPEDDEPRR
jgi:hypothetical protein